MDSNEIKQELNMGYFELCQYLQNKYGIPSRAYFANENCASTPQTIKRGNDGLYLHHISEYCCDDLAKPWREHSIFFELLCDYYNIEDRKELYWQFQKPDLLCYCNLLEHLLLHLKLNMIRIDIDNADIYAFDADIQLYQFPMSLNDVFSGGVINYLMPALDDIYAHPDKYYDTPQTAWRNMVTALVRDNEADYRMIIEYYTQQSLKTVKRVYHEEDIIEELEDVLFDYSPDAVLLCLNRIRRQSCAQCGLYEVCKASGASWLQLKNYKVINVEKTND